MKTSLCLTIAVLGLAIINLSTATVQAEDYRYITNNGTITITGYTGIGGDVIIPDTIDELPVTALGYYAFGECTKLTSIAIGNSVTSVGSWAFSGCTSLTSVVIPKGLINIGAFAFSECSNLANIILPRSLTNIGLGAFNPCSGLVAAYFEGNAPSYESLFGESPFTGCTNAIYFLPGTSDWDKPWRRGFETVPSIIPKRGYSHTP